VADPGVRRCGLAALLAPSSPRIGAALASIGAVVLSFVGGRGRPRAGLPSTPRGRSAPEAMARAADGRSILRPALVCLQTPGGLLAVWPDSMSPSHWRRLLWRAAGSAAGRQMADKRPRDAN